MRAATRSQLAQPTYLHHENGNRSLRGNAAIYAITFDVSAGWLVWGHAPPSWAIDGQDQNEIEGELTNVKLAPRFLDVRYRVQAGLWLEADADAPIESIQYAALPIPKYAQFPQWLELVVGDSANLKVQPGCYVHVVDAAESGYSPKTGDWVIVERRRDQGAVRERTIKQVEVKPDRTVLWPRSTNPKWTQPVDLLHGCKTNEEGVEAAIVGVVIGSIDPNF